MNKPEQSGPAGVDHHGITVAFFDLDAWGPGSGEEENSVCYGFHFSNEERPS